ncbi:MAG: hypothetical protein ACR2MQ_12560 [Gemmatimonadaceae bacterium]
MPKPRDQHDQNDHARSGPPDREGPAQAAREALNRQVSLLESMAADAAAPRAERLRAMELLAAMAGLRVGSVARDQLSASDSRPDTRPSTRFDSPRPGSGPREHRPAAHGAHGHGPPRRPGHDRPGEDRHDDDRHGKKGVRNRGASKFAKDGGSVGGSREPRRLNAGGKPPLSPKRPVRRLPSGG